MSACNPTMAPQAVQASSLYFEPDCRKYALDAADPDSKASSLRLFGDLLQASGNNRGVSLTLASLVKWCCYNGDNSFDPRLTQISDLSGLPLRSTQRHIQELQRCGFIRREFRGPNKPVQTTISDSFLKDLTSKRSKYFELPIAVAQLLGEYRVSVFARCVMATLTNQVILDARIRARQHNGDDLSIGDVVMVNRIAKDVKARRCKVLSALKELHQTAHVPIRITNVNDKDRTGASLLEPQEVTGGSGIPCKP